MPNSNKKTIVCNGCSCLCDDIGFDGKAEFENACAKGRSHLQQLSNRTGSPCFEYADQSIDLKTAVDVAAEILTSAKAPLVAGIEHLGTRAQQQAVNIGRLVGASIDTTLSNTGRSSLFSLQREGAVTATLGELANRAELVVFWYCDPSDSHPRFVERFCSRENQKTIYIAGDPVQASAAAQVCEMLLLGLPVSVDVKQATGAKLTSWQKLVDSLKACDYAAIVFDPQQFESCFDTSIDTLMSFAKRMNAHTRLVVNSLGLPSNSISAENVLAWSTGFAAAVNTGRGNRAHFLEYSAAKIFENQECDAALLFVGDEQESCSSLLQKIPRAVVVSATCGIAGQTSVSTKRSEGVLVVTCATYSNDDWSRMDDIIIPIQPTELKGDEAADIGVFLGELHDRLVLIT